MIKTQDWEAVFRDWAKPLSETETDKAERAKRMICTAINKSESLAKRDINVFIQGSYRNNTNVKGDSDVDLCACCRDIFIPDYSQAFGLNNSVMGFTDSIYTYANFKNDIEQALIDEFGYSGITRGNKAFNIHANSSRIDADVVPALEFRQYRSAVDYIRGTQIHTDNGVKITNWPEQHYTNGIEKNSETKTRFKYIVRTVKKLSLEMRGNGIMAAFPIPSYLIECLIYNISNDYFGDSSYKTDVNNCLIYLHETIKNGGYSLWMEINRIKYLFSDSQAWTVQQVSDFIIAAWEYINAK